MKLTLPIKKQMQKNRLFVNKLFKSLDMNPIEHLWDELGRRVRNGPNPPANLVQLEQMPIQEWANIPQQTISNYVMSMRQRCAHLLRARGGHTKY